MGLSMTSKYLYRIVLQRTHLRPVNHGTKDQSSYQIVEDKRKGKGTHVRGLVVRECQTEKEALNCLFEGAEAYDGAARLEHDK